MQEETPEALDGSTHFAFEHKVFRLDGCHFTADSDGDKPKFLMPLGDEMAAIAITALRREFGIADGSNDGRLLDIVTKSLKYVQEIRPNDSIPQELLDGSASWSVEERHRVVASDRIKIQLATLLTGREDQVIQSDQIEQLVDDPEIKRRVQEAFNLVAKKLGLPPEQKQEVINKIEQLGHEFSYIEGLLERFHTVTDIARKVDRLSKLYGDQNSSCDELSRVKTLLQRARSEFGMKFKAVNAQNCEMLTVLRGFDLYVQHIRDTRDDLHHRFMDWDETIKQWQAEEATAPSDEATLLIKQTYHFLAVRFTKTQKWGSVKK